MIDMDARGTGIDDLHATEKSIADNFRHKNEKKT